LSWLAILSELPRERVRDLRRTVVFFTTVVVRGTV
jgi:hypothetical protein